MQIFLTFGEKKEKTETRVESEHTPHYWLSFTKLITPDPLGHLEGAANLGEVISCTWNLLKPLRREIPPR